jgi:signal transduction histidine kinase
VFYVLAWPGLLPDRSSILGVQPGTAAWFPAISGVALSGCLIAAARARRREPQAVTGGLWPLSIAAWIAAVALGCVLLIRLEHLAPTLVRADGSFTPLLQGSNVAMLLLFAVGTVVSARGSQRLQDPLPGLAAFFQLAAAFVYLWVLIAPARYNLWWYMGRGALTLGALFVLSGLFSEYMRLLIRERDALARLQRALRSVQEADQRKNEFIAMLSHELRNPLAAVSTALQVWQGHSAAEPDLAPVREAALRQSRHMARLLDDLLDVSRVTRGRIVLDQEPVDLVRVVRDAVDTIGPQIAAKAQVLTCSLPDALMVHADPVRLTQAVGNLLHNASKYTPDGGHIDLTVAAQSDQAVIRVHDDGRGIADEVMPRIFDLFEQADQALDRSQSGLGIGLTVTRSLIEMHGGTIEAQSRGTGQGSEFVIRLPLGRNITHN